MSYYILIAIMAFFGLMAVPSKLSRGSNVAGCVLLAIIWPTLLVALVYYGTKRFVFNRGPSQSILIRNAEVLLCMSTAILGMGLVAYLRHDPFAVLIVRSFHD